VSVAKVEAKVPKRVLFIGSSNAGGELLSIMKKRLLGIGTEVRAISYAGATQGFKKFGIEPDVVLTPVEKDRGEEGRMQWVVKTEAEIARNIADFRPTSLLTDTYVQDNEHLLAVEHITYQLAKNRGILVVSVLDSWGNYSARFSDLRLPLSSDKLEIATPFTHMPDRIAIMDGYAMEKMLAEGFDPRLLVVTGQPYFEYVAGVGKRMPLDIRQQIYAKPAFSHFDPEGKLIVFISDVVSNYYPQIGYTEYDVLQEFLYAANALVTHGQKVNVIVRPHPFRPGRDKNAYEETHVPLLIGKAFHNPTNKEDPNYYTIEELLRAADLVVGTFNHPLFTARCLGTPVISYQPGLQGADFQAVTNERGITTLVTDEKEIELVMMKILAGIIVQNQMEFLEGAIDRVIELLQ